MEEKGKKLHSAPNVMPIRHRVLFRFLEDIRPGLSSVEVRAAERGAPDRSEAASRAQQGDPSTPQGLRDAPTLLR